MSLKNTRQNLFNSPEVSVKQQRLNTDQKAPRMFSESQFNIKFPVRVDEIVRSINKVAMSKNFVSDLNGDISIFPLKCNAYDTHVLQRVMNRRRGHPGICPPLAGTLSPSSYYAIAWMMCLCGHDACSSAEPSFRDNIDSLFEIFAQQYALGNETLEDNGISNMHEIELALFLQFLSWSPAALEWLTDKRSLDTVCNGLLTALSDKGKNPKDLSMSVACIAHVIDKHSAASRVLTSGNSCQLVRLLLSKTIYPNEEKYALDSTGYPSYLYLNDSWETQSCRLGLRKLLTTDIVIKHNAVRVEVNGFVRKWWLRLHQAAAVIAMSRSSQTVTIETQSGGNPDTTASIPPAVRNALDVLADISITQFPRVVDVSQKYLSLFSNDGDGIEKSPDVALLALAFGCREKYNEHVGLSFLMHFIGFPNDPRAANSATSLAIGMLRHLRLALSEQHEFVDSDQAGYMSVNDCEEEGLSATLRDLQTTAGVLCYDLFQQVLESAHRVSAGFAVNTEASGLRASAQEPGSVSSPSPELHTSSESTKIGPFHQSLFQHMENTSANASTPLQSVKGGRSTPTARPPLGVITNTAPRHDTISGTSKSSLAFTSKRSTPLHDIKRLAGSGGYLLWQQEMAWEPVLTEQVYLLQECASMARIREENTHHGGMSAYTALLRHRVGEWIQDIDAAGKCVILNDSTGLSTGDTSGGVVLVNMLQIFTKGLEDIKSAEDFDNKEAALAITHRLSGAVAVLLGLLSCVVNADYKPTADDDDATINCAAAAGHFSRVDDDDVVCYDGENKGGRSTSRIQYSSSRYCDESAATASPQEVLLFRQKRIIGELSLCVDTHEATMRYALETCHVSSMVSEEELGQDCCGCERCWCADTQWPPTFWNELHIQKMLSECKRSSPTAKTSNQTCTQTQTQGTLVSEDDCPIDRYSIDLLESSPLATNSKDHVGVDDYDENADDELGDGGVESRLSMSSIATNDSIELPPPPPVTASCDSLPPLGNATVTGACIESEKVSGRTGSPPTQNYEIRNDDNSVNVSIGATVGEPSPPSSSPTAQTDSNSASSRGLDSGDTAEAQTRREITRISTELSKMRMVCMKEIVAKEEHERRLTTTTSNLQQERNRVRELEEKLRQSENDRLCGLARESSLLEENQKVRVELMNVKIELEGTMKERDESEERCRSVEGMLEEAWQKMKAIAASEDASSKRADICNHQLLRVREDMLELERKFTILSGDLKASFALTDRLQNDISTLKTSERDLDIALKASQEEVEIYTCSTKTLESQVGCLEEDILKYQQQITDMTDRVESWKRLLSAHKSEISTLQSHVERSEGLCNTLRIEKADMDREHKKMLTDYEHERVTMEQQLVILTNEATRECERLHGIIADVRTQKEAIQSDLTSEMSRSCKLGKSLDKQVLIAENLQSELTSRQEVEKRLTVDLNAKQRECDELNADLLKHKELISYINRLSTEAEAKRNGK